MGTEQDKLKASRRRYQDETAVKKQAKIAKQHNVGGYQSSVEKEPHRLHKRHAMDCGNPECFLCGNPRKTHKDKLTVQEKRFYQDLDKTTDRKSNGSTKEDSEEV